MEISPNLQKGSNQIQFIWKKLEQVLRIRKGIYQNYLRAYELIKREPANENAKKIITVNLDRERKILGIIRTSSDEVDEVLEHTLRQIEKTEIDSRNKKMAQIMIYKLVEIMKFSGKRIKSIEKRIAMEEDLEEGNYSLKVVERYMKKLDAERLDIDSRLQSYLKDELDKLQRSFKDYVNWTNFRRAKFGVIGGAAIASLSLNKYYVILSELKDKGISEENAKQMAGQIFNQYIHSNEALVAVIILGALGFLMGNITCIYIEQKEIIEKYGV